jgi:PAS domain S-box-containing protein
MLAVAMDIPTLYVVFAGVLMASSVALIIAWRENPHEAGQRSWALGACSGAFSTLVFAGTAVSHELYWVNAVVNPFAWGAILLFARGVREYLGLVPTPRWMLLFFAIASTLPMIVVAYGAYERALTITIGSVVAARFCFDLALVLLRPTTKKSPASYFLVFFFGLWGVTHVIRAVMTALDPGHPIYERPIDKVMLFVGILGAATTAMGFAMLTTRRLRDARARNLGELERSVEHLRGQFAALAAGDYSARAEARGNSQHMDAIARFFNETVAQVGLAVEEIESQRGMLEATQDSLLDGLIVVDRALQVTSLNRAMLGLLGYQEADAVRRPLAELLAADDREFSESLLAEVANEPIRGRPTRFQVGDGPAATLTVNVSAYRDSDGEIEGLVLSVRDDRPLLEAQAQLQMTDRLAAMGTVAAGVAHEINNPLAFVSSNVEFAIEELEASGGTLESGDLDDLLSALQAAEEGSERIRKIVLDLKRFTRSRDDAIDKVDVNKMVESAAAMLENEVRHHARLELDLEEVAPVVADDAKLGQVFLNLIHNAAQAIPPGHASENSIRVSSRQDERGVVIEVTDTGNGISEDNQKRIFEAFFTTKPVGVGTGLGLAICHRVVSELDGSIEVESEVGKGSLFRVILPAADSTHHDDSLSEDQGMAPKVPRRKVLVIDDEVEVGQSARRILSRLHAVDVVSNASDGLALLGANDYDVIVCDLMMPEMTGMELYRELERTRPELATRVLFMTGGVFSPDAEAFLEEHRERVIAKPFDSKTLRRAVAEA